MGRSAPCMFVPRLRLSLLEDIEHGGMRVVLWRSSWITSDPMPSLSRSPTSLLPGPLFPHLTAVPGETAWLGTLWGHPSRYATRASQNYDIFVDKTKHAEYQASRVSQTTSIPLGLRPHFLPCPERGKSIMEACSWLHVALVLTLVCCHPLQ